MRPAWALLAAVWFLAPRSARAADDAASNAGVDGGPHDPDQEVIRHLDEIEYMELLQNLELFDPGTDDKADAGE